MANHEQKKRESYIASRIASFNAKRKGTKEMFRNWIYKIVCVGFEFKRTCNEITHCFRSTLRDVDKSPFSVFIAENLILNFVVTKIQLKFLIRKELTGCQIFKWLRANQSLKQKFKFLSFCFEILFILLFFFFCSFLCLSRVQSKQITVS